MATIEPRRFGHVIKVKPEYLDEYIRIHNPIPSAIATWIRNCNIVDYSIFYDGDERLFATFKYIGQDFDADMRKMQRDETTREWWKVTDAMQVSYDVSSTGSTDSRGNWWKNCREVFRQD
jgi:L-rhamnose mutarotase